MAVLTWDNVGERFYETGTDHGVLYIPDATGAYTKGVAWNGLTAVNETPSGAEANPLWADNLKYLNIIGAEEFGATIEAYTYPEEFAVLDGSVALADGVYIGQQARKPFGFSFRSKVGNDVEGDDFGYKLHFLYGCTASPSERGYQTVNDSPEAITFSWELTTTAVPVTYDDAGTLKTYGKPTACLTIDSTKCDKTILASLEDIIYGNATTDARLPLPGEIAHMFE